MGGEQDARSEFASLASNPASTPHQLQSLKLRPRMERLKVDGITDLSAVDPGVGVVVLMICEGLWVGKEIERTNYVVASTVHQRLSAQPRCCPLSTPGIRLRRAAGDCGLIIGLHFRLLALRGRHDYHPGA